MATPSSPITKGIAKVPIVLQLDMLECGAACLSMILAYYGKWLPLEQLRSDCDVNRNGSNAKNIVKTAKAYGLEYEAYKTNAEVLKKEGNYPCIIHWDYNHFVVLNGFKRNYAVINDPAKGKLKIPLKEFEQEFTGVVLYFRPGKKFKPSGKKKNSFSYLKDLISEYKTESVIIILATLISCILTVILLVFNKVFLDKVLDFDITSWLTSFLIVFTSFILFNLVAKSFLMFFKNRTKNKIESVLSTKYFWKVLHLPTKFFEQRMSSDISSRITSSKNIANLAVNVINPIIAGIVMMILYFFVLSFENALLAAIGVLALALNVVINIYENNIMEIYVRLRIRDTTNLHSTTVSGAQMVDEIKASGAEQNFMNKWKTYSDKVVKDESDELNKFKLINILPQAIKIAVNLFILFAGIVFIIKGKSTTITLGSIYLMQGVMTLLFDPFTKIMHFRQDFQTMSNQIDRQNDVLDCPVDDAFNSTRTINKSDKPLGIVEIKNLKFGYSKFNKPVLNNISLNINKGKSLAVCGPSGCGKSTLANLLAMLYSPWKGSIKFGGIDSNSINIDSFRECFSMVDQDIFLFNGTIEENITMGNKLITKQDIITAAKDACIHDEIMNMNGGYQHIVADNGSNLSGGQKQRIEIARALAKNPKIIILDEATSALDALTEHHIIDAIHLRGITCVMIAHRLSTIRHCDNIIVLKDGCINEQGSHDELIKNNGIYYKLVTKE